ncbi:MAG: tetratricopeptide repeat protein [Byssovorax sp.]
MKRGLPLVAAMIASGALSAPARADDNAAAEALFQQAKTLTEQQRYDEACPKFAASYKLDRTLGTLLNLADCEEHLGHVASAWAHWGEAVELAQKAGDKRDAFATTHRDALVKRLPMLQLDIAAPSATLEVFRDGVKIDSAAYGVPLPSDPGGHVVTVRRGGETLVEKRVVVREGETSALALDLVAIEKAAPPPAAAYDAPPSGLRTGGFVLAGVGAATILAAAGLEIAAIVNKSAADSPDACVQKHCTPVGIGVAQRANTFATAGQWVGIGGIVMAAVGVSLYIASPGRRAAPRPAAPVTVSGWILPGTGGISVQGAL